ncbi:cyclic nucleotide-binding-like protein [Ochromonadaceae sp. CCMP2298]|nr:cyclic nucleotide-binding-like protein [Ochromonadaceae sp. CCMP2298]
MLHGCLSRNFLIKTPPDLLPLIHIMRPRTALPGEVVVWQGSTGDDFFVLESGHCQVVRDGVGVGSVGAGESFGEMSLLQNSTRQATVRASTLCRLYSFSRGQYRAVAVGQEAQQLQDRVAFLESSS